MADNRLASLGLASSLRNPGFATVHSLFFWLTLKNKHKHSLSFAMHVQDLVLVDLDFIVQKVQTTCDNAGADPGGPRGPGPP